MALRLVGPVEQFEREPFPVKLTPDWQELFNSHGIEVRGRPLKLDWNRYQSVEREGRLVWIVAREGVTPVGYSGHYWYYDLHFRDEKIAADDLWYVAPAYRGRGIGRQLKKLGLAALREQGVKCSYDLVRLGAGESSLSGLGYIKARTQWKIEL